MSFLSVTRGLATKRPAPTTSLRDPSESRRRQTLPCAAICSKIRTPFFRGARPQNIPAQRHTTSRRLQQCVAYRITNRRLTATPERKPAPDKIIRKEMCASLSSYGGRVGMGVYPQSITRKAQEASPPKATLAPSARAPPTPAPYPIKGEGILTPRPASAPTPATPAPRSARRRRFGGAQDQAGPDCSGGAGRR